MNRMEQDGGRAPEDGAMIDGLGQKPSAGLCILLNPVILSKFRWW